MNWKCKIGIHNWKELKRKIVKLGQDSLFEKSKNITGIAIIKECKKCNKKQGLLSDGAEWQVTDIALVKHIIKRN